MLPDLLKGFLLLALIFIPLERCFYRQRQPVLRPQWRTDALYFLLGHFVGRAGAALSAFLALSLLGWMHPNVQPWVAAQPTGVQFLEAVLVADLGYYLAHRLLHTVPWLWQFHAIHHSVDQMDWLATVRVHPVDQVLTKTFQFVPLYWLGFTPKTLGAYLLFSSAIAFFIHANLRLRLGVVTWMVATPEFHHWHHTNDARLYNKNLAAQLPLLDWLFGTLYLPSRRRPRRFGVDDPVPASYWQQLLYPFHRKRPYAR